jgi:hypothetical protein
LGTGLVALVGYPDPTTLGLTFQSQKGVRRTSCRRAPVWNPRWLDYLV